MPMAHQCLQCGETFPDGSPQLLKGCPKCQGTRFFYTPAPVGKQEREALMQQANKDLRGILEDLVKSHGGGAPRPAYEDPVWSPQAREKWLQVDARKLRAHAADAVQEVQAPELPASQARIDAPLPPPAPRKAEPRARTEQAPLPLVEDKPRPSQTTPSLDDSEPREQKPEVVVVKEPGKYDIDVQQLLDHQPIVVRRDGVYVVHLPSVFAAAAKK